MQTSHGYHIDSLREMWHWRDWVIDAFNRNPPIRQFTVDQIAGDLLPDATEAQKIASGFNRKSHDQLRGWRDCGGSTRSNTSSIASRATSTTFMGLTMAVRGATRTSSNPITQKEFYQFFAFFNSVAEQGLDGKRGNAVPLHSKLPSDEQRAKLDELKAAIKSHEDALCGRNCRAAPGEVGSVTPCRAGEHAHRGARRALRARRKLPRTISGHYHHGHVVAGDPGFDYGKVGRAVYFDGDTEVSFGNSASFDRGHPFTRLPSG
jgi:hypothetical protein